MDDEVPQAAILDHERKPPTRARKKQGASGLGIAAILGSIAVLGVVLCVVVAVVLCLSFGFFDDSPPASGKPSRRAENSGKAGFAPTRIEIEQKQANAIASSARLAEAAKNQAPEFLYLEPHPVAEKTGLDYQNQIMIREVYRQAILIAARDNLGYVTRDGALGESAPVGSKKRSHLHAKVFMHEGKTLHLEAYSDEHGIANPIHLQDTKTVSRLTPTMAADHCENLINNTLTPNFEKLGYKQLRRRPKGAEEPVPEALTLLLEEMNYISQYQAVRWLHELMKTKGESMDTLRALVRAYANLGVLTEFHWDSGSKVFKARAILYARRLHARRPNSPLNLRYLAYAHTMVGYHRAASEYLQNADSLQADRKAKGARPTVDETRPEWVELIDAMCRFDSDRLAAAINTNQHRQLAQLLHFMSIEDPYYAARTLRVGQALLREIPDCYRVHDSLSGMGGVASQHSTTLDGMRIFSEMFGKRLSAIPDLPHSARLAIPTGDQEANLYRALIDSNRSTQDISEPSWAVVGRLGLETRFAQACRRLHFMHKRWGVSTQETAQAFLTLVGDHPLAAFVRSYTIDQTRSLPEYRDLIVSLPQQGYEASPQMLREAYFKVDKAKAQTVHDLKFDSDDYLYHDFLLTFSDSSVNPGASISNLFIWASPNSPIAKACLMQLDWKTAAPMEAELASTCQHPRPFFVLGLHYLDEKDYEKAEKYLNQSIALSPDVQIYQSLASAYKAQDKIEKWQATLEAFLNEPDPGLGHGRVQADIAEYWMSKKQYAKALPFAEQAAETGAGWGLMCAHQCNQALENWEKAEAYIRAISERYEDGFEKWHFWCVRTGKGDLKAAERFMVESFKNLKRNADLRDTYRMAIFNMIGRQKQQTVGSWTMISEKGKTGPANLFLSLAYDDMNKTMERNQVLSAFPEVEGKVYAPVAKLFRETLARGEKELPDLKAVEDLLQPMEPVDKHVTCLLVGIFLEQRGDLKNARRYLTEAASVQYPQLQDLDVVAIARLRAMGTELPRPAKEK